MNEMKKVAAVIVAAGNSTRMGSEISKQLIPLCNIPTIGHTLMAFENAHSICEIVVVCRESDMNSIRQVAEELNITKLKALVKGGSLRSDSVRNGAKATSEDIDFLAIHDGARPLITPDAINRANCSAVEHRAVALMVPVTVKVVDEKGVIVSTPERKTLRAAQTPQVFEKSLYMEALEKTKSAGVEFTDDCALVEFIGAKVYAVEGDYQNIKLTTPSDIAVAENFLIQRGVKAK
ncbi:MAG: 2-C-methyl-D-erythritol 4-phosphate cytidylyltransferase [Eubacteriales bacterium]|nr:2-C-methyl-D-erythritol 4-phosphate cytidylyltransferase [Eubacteriales bacterium]